MAILATFSDFRLVKGRKVAQFVFEMPIEQANDGLAALGGVPQPAAEQWVGIAPIDPKAVQRAPLARQEPSQPAKEARRFDDMPKAQQAALKCGDQAFRHFIKAKTPEEAAELVRDHCGVATRAHLDTLPMAAARWVGMLADFDRWQRCL